MIKIKTEGLEELGKRGGLMMKIRFSDIEIYLYRIWYFTILFV